MKSFILYALIPLVAGHSAMIKVMSDTGVGEGMGLGVQPDTDRTSTRRNPGQQDSTRFKGAAAATVGETLGGGANDIEAGTKAVMAMTGDMLPQVTPGGEVMMTIHQVNGDGAGPYKCMINTDGTATDWKDMTVTTNVPGRNGRDRDGATTDFPLNAKIPAGTSCTGTVAGQENVCMVRCENNVPAGPFGGVAAVQMPPANGTANTPAAARRNLAMALKRDAELLKKMMKRAATFEDDEEDLDDEDA